MFFIFKYIQAQSGVTSNKEDTLKQGHNNFTGRQRCNCAKP